VRNLHHIAWHHVFGLAQSARRGRLRVHLGALADALVRLPGWLRARRRIFAGRRIDLREFDRLVDERERHGLLRPGRTDRRG
jgi:hypothetical protein